ncbi:malto-oligosyltrehalose synthase [Rhizobium sp. CG5]|uniref:malto-oligosyltrehalose synthase n=1 Tax=Rhizobium sp. CG5 TaxID=2726076 RepID=UPI0020335E5E|nr:malto-oligosyltrehalose synthase [Rhizobium sp. CG5]MCM2476272.1 malto-oligosyltrehalose synthase [Rhizobium sp. CG5]
MPLPKPTATYRLQFRNGTDFSSAISLIPHLTKLGISHLYASPVFTATSGSTHGYDVTDCNEIDPALGGLAGLEQLSDALAQAGLGLILDIVPNHMAASLENGWWRSVVEWGSDSPYSGHFDIDWSQPLTLPFLGDTFEAECAKGRISVELDQHTHALAFRYYDSFYPLAPASYATALAEIGDDPVAEQLLSIAPPALPDQAPAFHARIGEICSDTEAFTRFQQRLAALSPGAVTLQDLHALQPYRLTSWKSANRHLSYRRFFEVAGLVGLRVEDRDVFEDSHRLVLDLVKRGLVQGLRVDHVDGLADPAAYLTRLRAAVGDHVYITVEKILERDEALPKAWPISGTTGYEFIWSLADALSDPKGIAQLHAAFAEIGDDERPYEVQFTDAKAQMLRENFAGEVDRLTALATEITERSGREFPTGVLETALCTMISALPVYRTYSTASGADDGDVARLESIAATAAAIVTSDDTRQAITFVRDLLKHNSPGIDVALLSRLRARFQQLSGPIMAKSLEDTLFYRFNGVLGLNEVGGNPTLSNGPAAFHAAMVARATDASEGLTTTSTHDTKRGEDARARLYALTEAPEPWLAGVERWRRQNAPLVEVLRTRPVPEPAVEWTLYQALAGLWPLDGLADPDLYDELPRRFLAYTEKLLREAKLRTSWTAPKQDYETAVAGFVKALFSAENRDFLIDFDETLQPYVQAGLLNALSQTMIKLTAPGIPDIYNGSERMDFSLVDPDNRRPQRLGLPSPAQPPHADRSSFGDYKRWLIATVLKLRQGETAPIFEGSYQPLEVSGPGAGQVIAYLRDSKSGTALTVVPRGVFGMVQADALRVDPALFDNTTLHLPDRLTGHTLWNALTGKSLAASPSLPVGPLFQDHPIALFITR